MRAAAIVLLCLSLQGCIGWAKNYVATHPDGASGYVPTGCDCCGAR
jgi:hypothetical protein